MKKIFLASDHAGIERKKEITDWLKTQIQKNVFTQKFEIIDLGPTDTQSVDYPDFANKVCTNIPSSTDETAVGILICGSGQGMAMRANKFPHIRAALCWNVESATLSREHNNANVLCFGARMLTLKMSENIVSAFLQTSFAGGRHSLRVAKISSPV